MQKQVLSTGWRVKPRTSGKSLAEDLASEEGWLSATVPSIVHDVLWQAGQIPNPYQSPSLPKLLPTFERDYIYRLRFCIPDELRAHPSALRLTFCGLDTVAQVWLNGVELGKTDNMFRTYSLPIGQLVREGEQDLVIEFSSALKIAQSRLGKYGPRAVWNGDPSRVYLRKAQYHFGWDFGPPLLSAGPWRDVLLDGRPARFASLRCPFVVADDLQTATLLLHPQVVGELTDRDLLDVTMKFIAPDGEVLLSDADTLPGDGGQLWRELTVRNPKLWWPHGHGEQPLYRLELQLSYQGQPLSERVLRLGARHLRLEQNYAQHTDGESFYFVINGRPIFCGGANWIPPELSLPRITRSQVGKLLDEATQANMCMLRVWGGGIYESDDFYDLCDEKGVLVFQDFGFACGLYPGHNWFAQNVAEEAREAVERLRHHPSLVLWAGNNEDYAIAQSHKLYEGPQSDIPSPPLADESIRFDGRILYEETLRDVVATASPEIPYWPGSPYGRQSADPNDRRDGDCHIWDVWHGALRDYQDYGELCGRFVSEFGMQAVPSLSTVERGLGFVPDGPSVLAGLNKGTDGPERIGLYLDRNFPKTTDLASYQYATQLLQAEALSHGIAGFRRRFGTGEARGCGGALVWQLDDCWPGVSWSILDHYPAADADAGRPVRRKASYYAIRRALSSHVIGMSWTLEGRFAIWASHTGSDHDDQTLSLRLTGFDLDGQKRFVERRPLSLPSNVSIDLGEVTLPDPKLVVRAELLDGDTVIARSVLWPQPLKNLALADPEVLIEEHAEKTPQTRTLKLQVSRPAKALWLSAGEDAVFTDNLLDVLPGEIVEIGVHDPSLSPIRFIGLHSLACAQKS